MLPGRRHGLLGDERRRLRERGEDPAGVEPARALAAEELVPVDLARLHLAGGRVATVRAAERRAQAEAALREVEAVANGAPDAVVLHEADVALVDAALVEQVLEQAADRVVDEGGDDRRALAEAAREAAGDVVLAAAFPDPEAARGVDPRVARVETQHHLAQAHGVEAAFAGRLDRKWHGGSER